VSRSHELNRVAWDAWAAAHGQDPYYDSAGLVAGRDSLTDLEWDGVHAAVGPTIAGLHVLHVQCHLAFDAITLARHGARVTGVDFSPAALAKAADLAARCGVTLDLVEGDAADLPAALHGRPTNVLYAHSLGEVVTAAADAGLRVVTLVEHLDSPIGEAGGGAREADGRHRLRVDGYCLPVLYTLIAERPA
jgi:hypothetical protein